MKKSPSSLFKRLATSKVLIVFEVLILVVLGISLGKEVVRKYQIENEIEDLQAEVASLEQSNIELNSLISYFGSDDYKEEQARLKLGKQRPGESVITVLGAETEPETNENADESSNQLASHKQSNPTKWWDYFFNKNS